MDAVDGKRGGMVCVCVCVTARERERARARERERERERDRATPLSAGPDVSTQTNDQHGAPPAFFPLASTNSRPGAPG